jgi:hypothetical protein
MGSNSVRPDDKVTVDKLPGDQTEMKAARPMGKISDVFGFSEEEEWSVPVD